LGSCPLVHRDRPRRRDRLPRLLDLTKREKAMSRAKMLQEKAEMFESRAANAVDPISKQHYKEMAAHYRSLAAEHLDVKRDEPAH
jgi:hypothetical protein